MPRRPPFRPCARRGSGKTRLADQVARLVAGRFADEVRLAELAAVRRPVKAT